jgi:hypothetical protein
MICLRKRIENAPAKLKARPDVMDDFSKFPFIPKQYSESGGLTAQPLQCGEG